MNNFLIGVTGERSEESKMVIFTIMNSLSLLHISMRQPFIDVLASITGVPSNVASCMAAGDRIGKLNCTVAAFEREFYSCVCGVNNKYFIESLGERLNNSMHGFTPTARNLFSGHIVSSINHAHEADYIRARGGIMLHLYRQGGKGSGEFHPRNAKLFDVTYQLGCGRDDQKTIAAQLIPLIRNSNKRAA